MEPIYVGITGINAIDNPGPGIGVARSLMEDRKSGTRIVGLAYDAMDPGIYMDWVVPKSFMVPYPSGDVDAQIQRLRYIKETHGLDVVIPNLDAELPFYIDASSRLAEHGIRTFLPSMEQFRLRGKERLGDIARDIRIEHPRTKVVTSLDGLVEALSDLGMPAMVKGCFYGAHKVHTVAEAASVYHSLVAQWGHPVLVQQVVEGDELNVVGLGDGKGQAVGLVAVKKVRVTSQGKMWTGITVNNEKILSAAARFVKTFKWRGPFELECIANGDKLYLIEVNPRFPAWTYLATAVGVNLPAQLLRCAMGMPLLNCTGYDPGKLFVRYSYELVTDMSLFQQVITRGEAA